MPLNSEGDPLAVGGVKGTAPSLRGKAVGKRPCKSVLYSQGRLDVRAAGKAKYSKV